MGSVDIISKKGTLAFALGITMSKSKCPLLLRNNQTFRIRNSLRAFTLTELIITIVIISMVAAFAIPNYQKAVRRTYERNAILHLTVIVASPTDQITPHKPATPLTVISARPRRRRRMSCRCWTRIRISHIVINDTDR